jgi:thiamine-phosphate pyrophosphorylase
VNIDILRRVLITDRALAPEGAFLETVARNVTTVGATMVVLRELDLPKDEQVVRARELIEAVPVPVLMARNPALALEAGAAGVQLGWGSPSPVEARAIVGMNLILGASVHSAEEGLKVAEFGVDYLLLGPIFPTPKRHGLVFPLGLGAIRELTAHTQIPVVAVGGLDLSHEAEALAAGAAGIAAIRAFMAPPPP